MTVPLIVFPCLVASYFAVLWVVTGVWQKALVTAVLAALVFSVTLLVTSIAVQNRPWRTFWIANLAHTTFFGGIELYALALRGTNATRFGGARLFDGHITSAGVASLLFDVGICVLSNIVGFCLARSLIKRLELS